MTPDNQRDDELERLAARIADDEPVNWQQQAGVDDALNGLRELQQLVQGYRHVQLGGNRFTPRSSRFKWGNLTVLEPIGSGAQGEVWRAYDPLLDLQVALKLRKVESDALSHQFLEEARRLARVRHANIVSVYGAAVHGSRAGLWTELIRGTPLAQVLAQEGVLAPDEVRNIGLDLCHALATVHRHGLIHGDIKAENVMREVSGRIVLMDFGAARELDTAQTPVVSGSLNYLAPEVLRGAPPSPASDIYALGVLLFRLIGGAYPYAADNLVALLAAQDRGARTRLASLRARLPKTLVRAIEQAIDPDPARRPPTALAFAAALAPAPARANTGWRALGAAALLAGLVAGAVSFVYSRWQGEAAPAWQTQAQFFRVEAHGRSALADGAAVAMGDRLAFEFRSSRPAHVYIFDDDGSAQAAVLFPINGLAPANPLAANTTHQLPGTSGATAMTWQITRRAQREAFVVIATDTPQPELEHAIEAWQRAGADTPGATRGALGLAPAPGETSVENAALHAALARVEQQAGAEHVRRWRFVFPHRS